MVSVPNPRTWVDREIPPYSTLSSEVYETLRWLLQPPMIKVRQTTTQSVPANTYTAIIFQTEDIDPYNWHNPSVNPTRVTPNIPGWYRGWFSLGFSTSSTGNYRIGGIQKNGAKYSSNRTTKPSSPALTVRPAGVPFFVDLNGSTDYVEAVMYQDSGAAMSTPVGSNTQSELFLRWWAPL